MSIKPTAELDKTKLLESLQFFHDIELYPTIYGAHAVMPYACSPKISTLFSINSWSWRVISYFRWGWQEVISFVATPANDVFVWPLISPALPQTHLLRLNWSTAPAPVSNVVSRPPRGLSVPDAAVWLSKAPWALWPRLAWLYDAFSAVSASEEEGGP